MTYIIITAKEPERPERTLKTFYRLTLLALAAIATARVILFAIDFAQSRINGSFGGEITLPAYIALFIYFGWSLKGWATNTKKRKERKAQCTIVNAPPAAAILTPENLANASALQRPSPPSVL